MKTETTDARREALLVALREAEALVQDRDVDLEVLDGLAWFLSMWNRRRKCRDTRPQRLNKASDAIFQFASESLDSTGGWQTACCIEFWIPKVRAHLNEPDPPKEQG